MCVSVLYWFLVNVGQMNKECVLYVMRNVMREFGKVTSNSAFNSLHPNTLKWLNKWGENCEYILKLYESKNNNYGVMNVAEGFKNIKKDVKQLKTTKSSKTANKASEVKSKAPEAASTTTSPTQSNETTDPSAQASPPSPSSQSPIAPKANTNSKK